MHIFQLGNFTLNSGAKSLFKIEADALTDADWQCIAYLLHLRLPPFGAVEGVPRGGLKLAKAMEQYIPYIRGNDLPILLVDDVLTTGNSMERQRAGRKNVVGAVWLARSLPSQPWITPLLIMTPTWGPQ